MLLPLSGVGGADVEMVVEGRLAAVVSPLGADKVRPQRANLAAHHRILHDLAEQRPVLPVVFGTITGNEEELRRDLAAEPEALAGLLDRLRGKVEMGLKVYWDLPNVFEYFVATHQELESMRNRLFRPGRTPTMEEKVELGERFVSLLQQARERHTRRVKETLAAVLRRGPQHRPRRGADDPETRLPGREGPASGNGKRASGRRPCSSTTTIASTTTAPGRLTTSPTWIWSLS